MLIKNIYIAFAWDSLYASRYFNELRQNHMTFAESGVVNIITFKPN